MIDGQSTMNIFVMPLNESRGFGVGIVGKLIIMIIGEIDTHYYFCKYLMTWLAGSIVSE